MTERLLGAKISEIDDTPLPWKMVGIGFVAFVMATAFVEVPLPFFPDPVFVTLGFRGRDIAFALGMTSPLFLGVGLYAGHVMEKMFSVESDDRSQNKGDVDR